MDRSNAAAFRAGAALFVVATVLCAAGCGGSSSAPAVTTPGISGGFAPSGMSMAGDTVRLKGSAVEDLVTVSVAIGGPTTSADLYSFACDLLLGNPSVVQYVPGSAEFGTALTTSGGQSPQVLASQNGERVTVGVTKLGGGTGNGVAGGEPAIVNLTFRVLRTGSSSIVLAGGPSSAPSALDSTGSEVPSVTFDLQPALISGN